MTKVRRKVVKRVDSRAITLGWEKKEECEIKNMLASNGKKNKTTQILHTGAHPPLSGECRAFLGKRSWLLAHGRLN